MENETKEIRDYLVKCIEDVLSEAQNKGKSPVFTGEWDFHSQLVLSLKESLPDDAKITVEYAEVNFALNENYSLEKPNTKTNDNNDWIDIVIEKDNKFYPIEIKYSEYVGKDDIRGSDLSKTIPEFINDMKKIFSYKAYNEIIAKDNKVIESGYCILITNAIEYMSESKDGHKKITKMLNELENHYKILKYNSDKKLAESSTNYSGLKLVKDFGYLCVEIPLKD